jgi:predicted esterase
MGGFSQGSAMTWNVTLRIKEPVAAAIGIGSVTWDFLCDWVSTQKDEPYMQDKFNNLHIFAYEGIEDKSSNIQRAREVYGDIMPNQLGFKKL